MKDINHWSENDKKKLLGYLGSHSYCSKTHKLFYVATPKVACTSLAWWFADLEGYTQALCETVESAELSPELIIHNAFSKLAPEVTGLHPKDLLEPLTSEAYFRFAVVRNPYQRIFSAWQSKLLLREPLQSKRYLDCSFFNRAISSREDIASAFEAFLEYINENEAAGYQDEHWTPQTMLLRPDLVEYSEIAKLEDVDRLVVSLREWLGQPKLNLFKKRYANESFLPYQAEFVTERSSELIRSLYADDFKVFGYNETPPVDKIVFSDDQFSIAIRAIKAIQGRNRRLGSLPNEHHELLVRVALLNEHNELLESEISKRDVMLSEANDWAKKLGEDKQALESEISKRDAMLSEANDWAKKLGEDKQALESKLAIVSEEHERLLKYQLEIENTFIWRVAKFLHLVKH